MTAAGIGNIIFFYIDVILYDMVILPLTILNIDQFKLSSNNNNNTNLGAKLVSSLLSPQSQSFLQRNKESVSFFISYLIQILAQHFLNAVFVYGLQSIATTERYLSTLAVTYSLYFASLIGSTICNLSLIRYGMSKNIAFWSTIFGFGLCNFFLLRIFIGQDADGKGESSVDATFKGKGGRKGSQQGRQTGRNTNRTNNSNNTSRVENKRGGKNVNSSVTAKARKIRGGYHQQSNNNNNNKLNFKLMKGLNSLLLGETASNDAQKMAFVQSVGSGVVL